MHVTSKIGEFASYGVQTCTFISAALYQRACHELGNRLLNHFFHYFSSLQLTAKEKSII